MIENLLGWAEGTHAQANKTQGARWFTESDQKHTRVQ